MSVCLLSLRPCGPILSSSDMGKFISKITSAFFALILCFGAPACFLKGTKNPGKVVGYSPGTVKTKKGSYGVGPISSDWRVSRVGKYKVLVLYSDSHKSSIESDAFCDQSYNDASLNVLTNHLHTGITEKKVLSESPLMLDGRAALRSVVQGKVDGVSIILDSVVIKKDVCMFDFVLISPPTDYPQAKLDFEPFFQGFRYTGDI